MIVSAIVAMAKGQVIGKDNDLPWYLPADLKHFKKITSGHHIIMGRKCFESIGKPLPKRTNVILTRNPYYIASNCIVTHDLELALELAYDNKEEEAFIIGGGEIYKLALPQLDRLYITEVDIDIEGKELILFPNWTKEEWELKEEKEREIDERNKMKHRFKVYHRK